jgi:transcriptional regulator with XRE-family HTH domain
MQMDIKDVLSTKLPFPTFLEILVEDKGLTIKEVAELTNYSQATCSRWLSGERTPALDEQEKVISILLKAESYRPKDYVFNGRLDFILQSEPFHLIYGHPNKIDASAEKHVVSKFICEYLVNGLKSHLKKKKFKQLDSLLLKGSVGQKNFAGAKVFWVAALDLIACPNGSTQSGIYVCILFDAKNENMYLVIMYGVENQSGATLERLTKGPKEIFNKIIKADPVKFNGFTTTKIDLQSKAQRPVKYEKSVVISKCYNIKKVKSEAFLEDCHHLLELYYEYINDEYTVKAIQDDDVSKQNLSFRTIDREAHQKRLAQQAELKSRIGKIGEEFVVEYEKKRLISLGRPDLAAQVELLKTDGDGHDVRSKCEKTEKDLQIEVKSSSLPISTEFRFFLTEREEMVARKLTEEGKLYYIYLVENVTKEDIGIFDKIQYGQFTMKPVLYKCVYKKN